MTRCERRRLLGLTGRQFWEYLVRTWEGGWVAEPPEEDCSFW
jgi:hypothetical protein